MDLEYFLQIIMPFDPSPRLTSEINRFLKDLQVRQLYELSYIKDIPDEPAYFASLKQELKYYIQFIQTYITTRLSELRDEGCLDLDAWIDCGLGLDKYDLPKKAKDPWASRAKKRTRRRRRRTCRRK